MRSSQKRNRPAFTLVEILVVVAIIAILVAIGIPAVQKSLDSAAMGQDLNNLRRIGDGIAAFAAENGGRIPNARFSAQDGSESAGTNNPRHSFMESVTRMIYPEFNPNSIFNWTNKPVWYSKRFARSANNQAVAWGMNVYLYYNASPLNNPAFNGVLQRAPNLSRLVLVGEKNDTGHEFDPRSAPVFSNNVTTRYRISRNGKAFYLFADYHVELIEGDQSVVANPTFNSFNATNRLFYSWRPTD